MADMTTIKERIAETIYPNGTGAITAASHQQLLLDMVDDFNEKKQDAEAGKGLVSDVERKQWNEKAEVDGRYPSMSVGFSDQLAGHGESTSEEFSFRASGGRSILDGVARIKELRGNAVVYNQLASSFEEAEEKPIGATITYLDNGVSLQNWAAYNPFRFDCGISQRQGHVLLLMFDYQNDNNEKYIVLEYGSQQFGFDQIGHIADIRTITSTDTSQYRNMMSIYFSSNQNGNVVIQNLRLIDLTMMFGAGNEPATIEEYYARKPIVADENAYNEGEMIADNSIAIKSIGDNAWDEQWELGRFSTATGENVESPTQIRAKNLIKVLPNSTYYLYGGPSMPISDGIWIILFDNNGDVIQGFNGGQNTSGNSFFCYPNTTFTTAPNAAYMRFYATEGYGATYNNDITISLYHSGWKAEVDNVYKPYEVFTRDIDQRILDAFPNGRKPWDKVYNKNGKGYIVKGTGEVDLGSLNWYYDASLGGFYSDTLVGAKKLFDGICAKYPFVGDYRNTTDKTCGYVYEVSVLVKDTAYTDAATFKTAMSGVMLWYELAEPEIIEYDEPFNLDYDVWDFGTEEAIAEGVSAPISANIIYLFNAVDMIRDHEARIAALEALITSLTNGGQ